MPDIRMDCKYRTRDGRAVRIYATDGGPESFAVHGAIELQSGWAPFSWSARGRYADADTVHDLIEVKPKRLCECWVVFRADCGTEKFTDYKGQAESACCRAKRYADECDGSILIHVKREEEEGHRDNE